MANTPAPSAIEDILAQYVGYTIGVGEQSGDSKTGNPNVDGYYGQTPPTVADGFRLDTIANGGAGKWFVVIDHDEYWSGNQGNKPPKQKGAITFWRRMGNDVFANWEYLTVGITSQKKDDDSTNEETPDSVTNGSDSGASDPVNTVGNAWLKVVAEVPKLVGPGTQLDYKTLQIARDTLAAIGVWADQIWKDLDNDISKIDTKAANFEGSAAQGFRDLVADAQRGMDGILAASTGDWNANLQTAVDKVKIFAEALTNGVADWIDPKDGSPLKAWIHPLATIIHMFNESHVTEVEDTSNVHNGDDLYNDGIVKGDQSVIYDTDTEGNSSISGYKTMIIQFPTWSGVTGTFDVLRTWTWDDIDRQTRAAWVAHVRKAFAPAVTALQPMVDAVNTASLNATLKEMEPPATRKPPGGPDLSGIYSAIDDIYSHFSDINGAFSDINGAFSDINGAFSDINGAFSDINGAFSDINGAFSDINGAFSDINGAFSDINGAFSDINGAFSDVNGAFSDINGAFSDVNGAFSDVNDAFSDVNGAFSDINGAFSDVNDEFSDVNGAFSDVNGAFSDVNDAFSDVNGAFSDVNGAFSDVNGALGDLGDGLGDLGDGLEDGPGSETGADNPLMSMGLSRMLASGNPNDVTDGVDTTFGGDGLTGDPQNLGDLTGTQLQALADQGLLDDTPLTDQERQILSDAGLDAGGATTLGDLDDQQLQTLLDAGALDTTAITPQQTSALVGSGLLDVGEGADDLGDLSSQQLQTLQDAGLLDGVQLTDQDLAELQKDGLLGSGSAGLDDLGDLNSAQLQALSDAGLLDDVPTTQDQIGALDAAGQLGAADGSIQNLGDLSPAQLTELDSAGLLDDTPVTQDEIRQLQQDGLLGQDTTGIDTLGDLSDAQLQDLRQHGLLDSVPVTTAQLSDLDTSGLLGTPDNLSSSLGDLTSDQLTALDDSGLLDDNPITQDQIQELQQDGLLGSDTSGIGSLGDLNSAQLQALDDAGLLDDVPVTDPQSTALGSSGLSSLGSSALTSSLGSSLGGLGSSTPSSAFPTNIDGFDVNPVSDLPSGSVGNIANALDGSVPGGSGRTGFGTSGMNVPTGFDLGDLADTSPKVAAGAGAIGGPDDPLTNGSSAMSMNVGNALSGGGGMPYMPMGGMGGMGGSGSSPEGKDRERQTWLVEDDDIWGTDPEVGAAVIGRGDSTGDEEEQEYGREITPEQPGGPRRPSRRTARGGY
jgi:hypothetical protein